MTGHLITAALLAGAIFAAGLFSTPPRRGRHHVHAWLLARPFERERPTVDAIARRLELEARYPLRYLRIVPDVQGFREDLRDALGSFEAREVFA